MSKNFLYLNINQASNFNNTIPPQPNSACLFLTIQDGKLVLSTLDENGNITNISGAVDKDKILQLLYNYVQYSEYSDSISSITDQLNNIQIGGYVQYSQFSDSISSLNDRIDNISVDDSEYVKKSQLSDSISSLTDQLNNIKIVGYVQYSEYSDSISSINNRIDNLIIGEIDTNVLATKEQLNQKVDYSEYSDSISNFVSLDNNGKISVDVLPDDIQGNVSKNANITLPIPYDKNNDNITFIMDVCENGQFLQSFESATSQYSDNSESLYNRISMKNPIHRSYMKIFAKDKFIDVPDTGINITYYGQNLSLTLNKIILPNYVPGNTYYARYTWMDYQGAIMDWKGFKFQFDAVDASLPLKTQDQNEVYEYEQVMSDYSDSSSTLDIIDYNNGEIQKIYWQGNFNIDTQNCINIPYGKTLKLFCIQVDENGESSITSNSNTTNINNKSYLIEIHNVGELVSTIKELY